MKEQKISYYKKQFSNFPEGNISKEMRESPDNHLTWLHRFTMVS